MDPDLKALKIIDPLRKQAEVDLSDQEGASPFNPPDAFSKPLDLGVAPEDMDPYLRGLMSEHAEFLGPLDTFDGHVAALRKAAKIDDASFANLKTFFDFFDNEIVPHSRREEQELFVTLRRQMLAHGEHSVGPDPITPVAVLEQEHADAIRTSAIAFSFLALARKLEHEASVQMVLSIAIDRCEALSKMLRLHIFREDRIAFVLAQDFVTAEEFAEISSSAS